MNDLIVKKRVEKCNNNAQKNQKIVLKINEYVKLLIINNLKKSIDVFKTQVYTENVKRQGRHIKVIGVFFCTEIYNL